VIIDPPGRDRTRRFSSLICLPRLKRVVYVSCNPAAQIRDLKVLSRVAAISAAVDLFPQTKHLE